MRCDSAEGQGLTAHYICIPIALCGCNRAVAPSSYPRFAVQSALSIPYSPGDGCSMQSPSSWPCLSSTYVASGRRTEARTRSSWLQVAQLCPRVHVLEHLQPVLFRFAEERVGCTDHRTDLRTQANQHMLRHEETGTVPSNVANSFLLQSTQCTSSDDSAQVHLWTMVSAAAGAGCAMADTVHARLHTLTPTVTAITLPAMCAARRGHHGLRAEFQSSIGSTRSRGTYLHEVEPGSARHA